MYISALCVLSVCLWECVLGTCLVNKAFGVCRSVWQCLGPVCRACSLSSSTCAHSRALHVCQPPCARPRVTRERCARTSGSCALGALEPVSPDARRHLHMSGCTPPVSVCWALHARAFRPAGDQGHARGSTRPAGLTPFPRPATGHRDWPPAPSQPSPLLPSPRHPRSRGPRCPPRFRRGRAALRSAPIGCARLCVAAAAAPAPLNVERGREGSLSMGHLSPRQPPPRRRPCPALRLPPRRLPQPRRRPRPRPGAAPQRARAQPPPPPPREEPGWSWSTSAISCFQCLALCETEVSLFPFGVRFGAWIAAGTGVGAGAEGGGGLRAHPRGRGASGGFSPLPFGGTPSVEVAALVGAFAVKLGFGDLSPSLPPSPAPLFILCGGPVPPNHSPFPQYLALCDRRTERDTGLRVCARACVCVCKRTWLPVIFFLRCVCVFRVIFVCVSPSFGR